MVEKGTAQLHILAVGAHAGDMEISAGAAILKHTRRGHKATLAHLTLGARGHRTLSEAAYRGQKQEEATVVAHHLGAEARFFPYGDGELFASEEAKWAVADLIRESHPTHVLTHWPGSIHKDHVAAYEIVKDALYYAAVPAFKRQHPAHEPLGPYLTENWEDDVGYVPHITLDVSDVFDDWLAAVKGYELFAGGVSDFDYLGYYTALASLRGTTAGYAQAVTFATDRPLAAFLSDGFDQSLRLYTSTSPMFRPRLKRNTVG